jgi:5-methylcytosine-specific restriction endonuclease McrA
MTEVTCSVDECEQKNYGRGLCVKHYKVDYYHRTIDRRKMLLAAWIEANPGRKQAMDADYYKRNSEVIKARSAAYRVAHPEESHASSAAWREANPERKRALDAAWQVANMDLITPRRAAYHQANKEKSQQGAARRKARKLGNECERVSYVAILAKWGMVCHICGGEITDRSDLHFDHVIPLARGGAHAERNIRPSHAFCNLSKGARLLAG